MRVVHLVGSPESAAMEDLSRLYAEGALEEIGGDVAYVTPDGAWRFPDDLSAEALAAAPPHRLPAAIEHLLGMAPDIVVPQLFCHTGMTHFRALLDVLGLPYVGNGPEAMALGADKALARAVVAAAGVTVPAGLVVARGRMASLDCGVVALSGAMRAGDGGPAMATTAEDGGAAAGVGAQLRLPVVVKPVAADNSDGVACVRAADELAPALEAAWAHGDALVETYVPAGREVRCATLERGGDLQVLPLEEYPVGDEHPIRLAADKLAGSGRELRLAAKTADAAWIVAADDPVCAAVGEAARRAHRALGCRHYGLFDFRVDPAGRPWFLEAGLYCSFSRASVVATMARAAGIGTRELFDICVEEALR